MLEQLESVPWSTFAQPTSNEPSTVPDAFRRLAAAVTESEGREAYHRFLFAIGNNHAGTYFPVVLHTLPFLEAVLRAPGLHARHGALEALIDLIGAFVPDPSFASIANDSGEPRPLRELVMEQMQALVDPVRTLALDLSADHTTRRLACDLLDLLPTPPPGAKAPDE